MNRVVVSLGSNIQKEKNLPQAVLLLRQRCHVVAVSSVYETKPVGLKGQPIFWNAAAIIDTELGAADFKREILAWIEQRLERKRSSDPNAPRTIDVDITLYNTEIFDLDESHHIPDPDLLRYPHVSVPIAELLPNMLHPETMESMEELSVKHIKDATIQGIQPPQRHPDIKL